MYWSTHYHLFKKKGGTVIKRQKKFIIIKNILVGIVALLFVLIPFWMVVVNSFKPAAEAAGLKLTLPERWNVIENYSTVIREGKLGSGFLNSLLLTFAVLILSIFIASMASWIIARVKSKYISIIYFILISGVLIAPPIITSIKVMRWLNIYGNLYGLVLFQTGIIIPFGVFFITGFIKTIPIELEEAAKIDGCSNPGVFFRIILPLLKPIIFSTVIIFTLFVWNDFIYAFYMLSSSKDFTITLGLYYFAVSNLYTINWHLVFANVILISLPFVIMFFVLQRKIFSGIMAGAIKQ
jgi:raffinose/stachyose/melibiose transport system permease protein